MVEEIQNRTIDEKSSDLEGQGLKFITPSNINTTKN